MYNLESQSTTDTKQAESAVARVRRILRENKKKVFTILVVILILESLWAVSYVLSTKGSSKTNGSKQFTLFKKEIASLSFKLNTGTTDTITVNSPFTVDIVLDSRDRQVNGVDVIVLYDPQILSVVDSNQAVPGIQVENGTLFRTLLVNNVDENTGRITLTLSRLNKQTPAITGTGTLASITFLPQQIGTTTFSFLFDETKTNTSNVIEAETSSNILTNTNDVSIEINN